MHEEGRKSLHQYAKLEKWHNTFTTFTGVKGIIIQSFGYLGSFRKKECVWQRGAPSLFPVPSREGGRESQSQTALGREVTAELRTPRALDGNSSSSRPPGHYRPRAQVGVPRQGQGGAGERKAHAAGAAPGRMSPHSRNPASRSTRHGGNEVEEDDRPSGLVEDAARQPTAPLSRLPASTRRG